MGVTLEDRIGEMRTILEGLATPQVGVSMYDVALMLASNAQARERGVSGRDLASYLEGTGSPSYPPQAYELLLRRLEQDRIVTRVQDGYAIEDPMAREVLLCQDLGGRGTASKETLLGFSRYSLE